MEIVTLWKLIRGLRTNAWKIKVWEIALFGWLLVGWLLAFWVFVCLFCGIWSFSENHLVGWRVKRCFNDERWERKERLRRRDGVQVGKHADIRTHIKTWACKTRWDPKLKKAPSPRNRVCIPTWMVASACFSWSPRTKAQSSKKRAPQPECSFLFLFFSN